MFFKTLLARFIQRSYFPYVLDTEEYYLRGSSGTHLLMAQCWGLNLEKQSSLGWVSGFSMYPAIVFKQNLNYLFETKYVQEILLQYILIWYFLREKKWSLDGSGSVVGGALCKMKCRAFFPNIKKKKCQKQKQKTKQQSPEPSGGPSKCGPVCLWSWLASLHFLDVGFLIFPCILYFFPLKIYPLSP